MTQLPGGGEPFPDATEPHKIQAAEQMWAEAKAHLDKTIKTLRDLEPGIYEALENSDPSVLFDYFKGFLVSQLNMGTVTGNPVPYQTTVLMCAAAITELVRAPRTTDDPLARLDKEFNQNDDQ